MQEVYHAYNRGGVPATTTHLMPAAPVEATHQYQGRGSSQPFIGSDSSFASSEASFSLSETSYTSSRTSDSHHTTADPLDLCPSQVGSSDDGGLSDLLHSLGDSLERHDFQSDVPSRLAGQLDQASCNVTLRSAATQWPAAHLPENFPAPQAISLHKLAGNLPSVLTDQHGVPEPPPGVVSNPRRSAPDHTRIPPSLVRQDARKKIYVSGLMGVTAQLVQTIWPDTVIPGCVDPNGPNSLRNFIKDILHRSRASHSTLQVAMYYCYLVWKAKTRPAIDGRRMFLASVMLAFKYLQDRNYSARAWSGISGLPKEDIMATQLAFLECLDFRIFLDMDDWEYWITCFEDSLKRRHNQDFKNPWPQLLRNMRSCQIDLEYHRNQRRIKAAAKRFSEWDWSADENDLERERPVTAHRLFQSQGSEILTPPVSPANAPNAPAMTALSTPDDTPPTQSGNFVVSKDLQKLQQQQQQQQLQQSKQQRQELQQQQQCVRPAELACSAVLPLRTGPASFEDRPSKAGTEPHEGSHCFEQATNPHFTREAHRWYEEYEDLIDDHEHRVDRRLATRTAKKLSSHPHHPHHSHHLHIRRKRSLSRCLGKDVDPGKEGKTKSRCQGMRV